MANPQTKRVGALINDLRNIGPTSDAKIKFIVDKTPFDNPDQPLPSGDWVIEGRLLPNSNLYAQGAIRVHITLPSAFPFQPPNVILKTKVYHPNVSDDEDEVSIDLINPVGSWTPQTSLVSVIESVTSIIDTPSLDLIQNPEAAHTYDTNLEKYEQIASSIFNSNCAPRN